VEFGHQPTFGVEFGHQPTAESEPSGVVFGHQPTLGLVFGHQPTATTDSWPELLPAAETAAVADMPAAASAPATRSVARDFFIRTPDT
jgi:hypothetical protein